MGNEFVIGFMDNEGMTHSAEPIQIYISTTSTDIVHVNITTPIFEGVRVFRSVTVTKGDGKRVELPERLMLKGSELVGKGILVEADGDVTIHGVNQLRPSTDGFLAIPIPSLGTQYFIVTWYPTDFVTQFLIVGTENETHVEVCLSLATNDVVIWKNVNYSYGDSLVEILDRLMAFQIQSSGDLTGTYITTSAPVAVFSGNRKTSYVTKWKDHVVDMLPPVQTWGRQFVAFPYPTRIDPYYVKIISSTDFTKVTIECSAFNDSHFLSQGEIVQVKVNVNEFCFILSNNPILVVQLSISWNTPAMVTLTPLSQSVHRVTFPALTPTNTKNQYDHFFVFMMENTTNNSLVVDGNIIYPQLSAVTGTEYVGGYISLSEELHEVTHIDQMVAVVGYVCGYTEWENYVFATGRKFKVSFL